MFHFHFLLERGTGFGCWCDCSFGVGRGPELDHELKPLKPLSLENAADEFGSLYQTPTLGDL